jgi:hypothetical protein
MGVARPSELPVDGVADGGAVLFVLVGVLVDDVMVSSRNDR